MGQQSSIKLANWLAKENLRSRCSGCTITLIILIIPDFNLGLKNFYENVSTNGNCQNQMSVFITYSQSSLGACGAGPTCEDYQRLLL